MEGLLCIKKNELMGVSFNNISVTSWESALLVQETVVQRENDGSASSH